MYNCSYGPNYNAMKYAIKSWTAQKASRTNGRCLPHRDWYWPNSAFILKRLEIFLNPWPVPIRLQCLAEPPLSSCACISQISTSNCRNMQIFGYNPTSLNSIPRTSRGFRQKIKQNRDFNDTVAHQAIISEQMCI